MSATSEPSWEDVLDGIERDVARTHALLVLAVADPGDPAEARFAEIARQLMSADPVAPPLARMPAVPPALLERAQALRARIAEVRTELEAAMTTTRRQLAGTPAVAAPRAPEPAARFIDRTA
jgi:hypothetical protein